MKCISRHVHLASVTVSSLLNRRKQLWKVQIKYIRWGQWELVGALGRARAFHQCETDSEINENGDGTFRDAYWSRMRLIGHFWVDFSLYFKASLHTKSLLWISVFIHIEIKTTCHWQYMWWLVSKYVFVSREFMLGNWNYIWHTDPFLPGPLPRTQRLLSKRPTYLLSLTALSHYPDCPVDIVMRMRMGNQLDVS